MTPNTTMIIHCEPQLHLHTGSSSNIHLMQPVIKELQQHGVKTWDK